MSGYNPNRQSKGRPDGGQFAPGDASRPSAGQLDDFGADEDDAIVDAALERLTQQGQHRFDTTHGADVEMYLATGDDTALRESFRASTQQATEEALYHATAWDDMDDDSKQRVRDAVQDRLYDAAVESTAGEFAQVHRVDRFRLQEEVANAGGDVHDPRVAAMLRKASHGDGEVTLVRRWNAGLGTTVRGVHEGVSPQREVEFGSMTIEDGPNTYGPIDAPRMGVDLAQPPLTEERSQWMDSSSTISADRQFNEFGFDPDDSSVTYAGNVATKTETDKVIRATLSEDGLHREMERYEPDMRVTHVTETRGKEGFRRIVRREDRVLREERLRNGTVVEDDGQGYRYTRDVDPSDRVVEHTTRGNVVTTAITDGNQFHSNDWVDGEPQHSFHAVTDDDHNVVSGRYIGSSGITMDVVGRGGSMEITSSDGQHQVLVHEDSTMSGSPKRALASAQLMERKR